MPHEFSAVEPLKILYLDDVLVAIDKPAGMLVHPGREDEGPEWVAMKRVRDLLGRQVHTVHRLDRPTSGVLLLALDKETCTAVQQDFEHRRVEKTYLAIVAGITPDQWTCATPLQRGPDTPARSAETRFQRLASTDAAAGELALSLLEVKPRTGRYHQIRRHLLEAGHPIIGDFRYAGVDRSMEVGEMLGIGTRMLLQASSLRVCHPRSGIDLVIEAPWDPDFGRCFPAGNGSSLSGE